MTNPCRCDLHVYIYSLYGNFIFVIGQTFYNTSLKSAHNLKGYLVVDLVLSKNSKWKSLTHNEPRDPRLHSHMMISNGLLVMLCKRPASGMTSTELNCIFSWRGGRTIFLNYFSLVFRWTIVMGGFNRHMKPQPLSCARCFYSKRPDLRYTERCN